MTKHEDLMYSRLTQHQRAVDQARRYIDEAFAITSSGDEQGQAAKWSVSFSGGKDSTVLLHLVRAVRPDTVAIFVDSGAEYPETLEMIAQTENVYRAEPALTLLEMYRIVGAFGSDALVPDSRWRRGDVKKTTVVDPIESASQELGVTGHFTGIRAEESVGRRRFIHTRPRVWQQKVSSGYERGGILKHWRCEPLAHWTWRDVWAYIAAQGLPYNRAYDILESLGVPRKLCRVSPYACSNTIGLGGWSTLKRGWPELFNRFASEFKEARSFL